MAGIFEVLVIEKKIEIKVHKISILVEGDK